jgi:hypothetical protein
MHGKLMELERDEDDEEEVVYCLLFGADGVAAENLLPSILTRLLFDTHSPCSNYHLSACILLDATIISPYVSVDRSPWTAAG